MSGDARIKISYIDPTIVRAVYEYDGSQIPAETTWFFRQAIYDSNNQLIYSNSQPISYSEVKTGKLTTDIRSFNFSIFGNGDGIYFLPNYKFELQLSLYNVSEGTVNSVETNFEIKTNNADTSLFALKQINILDLNIPELPIKNYSNTTLVFDDGKYSFVLNGDFSGISTGKLNGKLYSVEYRIYDVSQYVVFGEWDLKKFDAALGSRPKLLALIFSSNDYLLGSDSSDVLIGLSGNDYFIPSFGDDTVDGGLGQDVIKLSGNSNEYSLAQQTVTGTPGYLLLHKASINGQDYLINVEQIQFDDELIYLPIIGNSAPNSLSGGTSSDQIYGYAGNDTINAFSGDDTIYGGDGNDTYDGGVGSDTVDYTIATARVTVNLTKGTARSTAGFDPAGIGTDKLKNIENIVAGDYNDLLIGSKDSNVIDGGKGNDTLDGGLGNDTLIGGEGSDVLVLNAKPTVSNIDTISDFQSGTDKVQLSRKIFTKLKSTIDFLAFGNVSDSHTHYLIYDKALGKLSYDSDGNGIKAKPVDIALIGKGTELSASDIVII